MGMKAGDLVRHVPHPGTIPPPPFGRPIGIILEIRKTLVGEDEESRGCMETILVKWSDEAWNGTEGFSEEIRPGLELIQGIGDD